MRIKKAENEKITALYERLSRDDEIVGDNNSIVESLTVEYKKNACRPYKTCFFYVKFLDFISVILCYCVL